MTSGIDRSTFDPTVRPQDNLFEHVNGAWLERTAIPGDRGRYGTFDILREQSEAHMREIIEDAAHPEATSGDPQRRKVGDLYASFMDEADIEGRGTAPLRPWLDEVAAVSSSDELVALLGRLQAAGLGGVTEVFVGTDDRAPEENIAYLEQGGLGLPDESYYRDERHAQVLEAYTPHVARMLRLAGVYEDAAAAEAAAQRVVALETRLARGHWDNVATRDPVKTYTKADRAALAQLAPELDWAAWATGLEAPDGALDTVIVRQPSFLTAASQALADEPIETWRDWASWHVVHALAPYLSSELVDESFDFYGRQLSGLAQQRERWKRGVSLVEGALGEAAGELYVAKHFPPESKARMEHLVDNLVEAFRRDFGSLAWMSEATRAEALAKLERFTAKIGYPARWRDYSGLDIDRDDLVGNVVRAGRFEMARNLAKVGAPVDRDEWYMTPQTVNAYYNPGMNEIVFPAAILQPPFFDPDADDAVNYGGIGGVIGHEIGHGFDDQGSQFDGSGALRDWWTEQDREQFMSRAQALIAQFDTVESIDAPGNTVNGALTVGENIGDLGGLTIGYAAYQIACESAPAPVLDGWTGSQRFFLGWAQVWKGKARPEEAKRLLAIDPHSPTDARANVCRNLTEFHEAFGTVPGDGMWLDEADRVRIF